MSEEKPDIDELIWEYCYQCCLPDCPPDEMCPGCECDYFCEDDDLYYECDESGW